MQVLAPVCVFCYNRPHHLKLAIESLKRNIESEKTDLLLFSDGPKSDESAILVAQVREFARSITGFQSIHIVERPSNMGLAGNIIAGVTEVLSGRDAIIVMEDDLVVSPGFLRYMNEGLARYRETPNVASIHGYVYPLKKPLSEPFWLRGADCWGWATWKRAWSVFEPDGSKLVQALKKNRLVRRFNFDNTYPYFQMLLDQTSGKNDSWAIRWYASAFLADLVTLYPNVSLVQNIGLDGTGTHGDNTNDFSGEVADASTTEYVLPKHNHRAFGRFKRFFRNQGR